MSGLKEIRTRLDSAKSTQQLTNAMKMVSVSKLRKAQLRSVRVREMCFRLLEIYRNIAQGRENICQNTLMHRGYSKVATVLVIVLSSDKGMCGTFNSTVCRAADAHIREKYGHLDPRNVIVLTIGSKAADYFKDKPYRRYSSRTIPSPGAVSYEDSVRMMEKVVSAFRKGDIHKVDMVYCRPVNAATQIVRTRTVLPVDYILEVGDAIIEEHKLYGGSSAAGKQAREARKKGSSFRDVELLPDLQSVIDNMLPKIAILYFYLALCQSSTAEHGARMTAMSQASENADTLIKTLNLRYNKQRQSSITNELIEIVSGSDSSR